MRSWSVLPVILVGLVAVSPPTSIVAAEEETPQVAALAGDLCFDETTPPEMVWLYSRLAAGGETSLTPSGPYKYAWFSRWPGGSQGDPVDLTWSIIPDGTMIPGASFVGEPSSVSALQSFLDGIYGAGTWLPLVQQVFDRWSEVTGITYTYEPNDDGAAFPGSSGSSGVRGDIRIGGHPIDGPYMILAYNYFPGSGGDMVLDSSDTSYNDTSNNSRRLRNVMAHENGHGFGFNHVCPTDDTKLMEPYLNLEFDGPQHDDILGANYQYGGPEEPNDSFFAAVALGTLDGQITVDPASLHDDSDQDFFYFTLSSAATLDLSLTPVGHQYEEGDADGNGICSGGTATYDSLTNLNLGVQILNAGQAVVEEASSAPAGQPELISRAALAAGTYRVKVWPTSTADESQLYTLELDTSGEIFSDGFESGDTTMWSLTIP